MNTKTKHSLFHYLKSKLLIKLWLANMLIVGIAIIFLWIVQIWLFEPNYTNATMDSLLARVEQNADELSTLETIDPNSSDNPLLFLSKTIVGMVFLVDSDGTIIQVYNNGRSLNAADLGDSYSWLLNYSGEVINGTTIKTVQKFSKTSAIIMGVPTTFQNEPVSLLLYNTITQIDTLQSLNRQQLLLFSIILSIVTLLISFLLARHFTKPINKIKDAVTNLTQGNLDSVPNVQRLDELGILSDSVSELSTELQRVDILRKEVIANVSHELRAPLSLITGYGEMVRDVTGKDETLRNNNMDLIISEANRLNEMVDDIMDYSMLQAGYYPLNLESCNFYKVVEASVSYGQNIAQQYGIDLSLETFSKSIHTTLDPIKISQVLRNLINNAINHTTNEKEIRILIEQVEQGIKLSLINPGEDIPQDQIDYIWERYQRVQHQGGRKEGTGIGLAIVSTILTAHDYQFGANSSNGLTCFWFLIPS